MCGIAGYISNKPLSEKICSSVIRSMKHRGPDGSGTFQVKLNGKYLTLMHTRLSIQDLKTRSSQPFLKHECALVFNGEIYNFIEIREKLKKLGRSFKTSSDTEVVLEAYLKWGINCVDIFEGMWSIALYDKKKEHLWLSRDRFGEKPFYISQVDNNFIFASEIKSIAIMLGEWPKVNDLQVRRYLVQGFKSLYKSSDTWFKNIIEFPRASNAILKQNEDYKPKKYWGIKYKPSKMSLEEAIEGSKTHLFKSLDLRMRADVPIAFCLSGGVDSTSLASIASKKFGKKIHTFSIIDSDPRYDESKEIKAVVNDIGCEHHAVKLDYKNFFERMKKLIKSHDTPVSTISYYAHSFLSEDISKKGYKVAISGAGADELYTGYYDHYNFWLSEMKNKKNFRDLLTDWKEGYGKYVRNPKLKDPEAFISSKNQRDHIYLNSAEFNEMLVSPIKEEFSEGIYTDSPLRNRMINELLHEIIPVILKEDDLNSMKWSVENRCPFLDRDLVDFMFTVPDEYLIRQGYAKWLLRETSKDYLTNEVRMFRQKKGFNASIKSLVDFEDNRTKDFLLCDSPIFDYVKYDAIEKLIKKKEFSNSYSKFMFSFISAKIFLEQNNKPIN